MTDYDLSLTGSDIDAALVAIDHKMQYICDPSEGDQGAAGNGYSLKDLVDNIGTTKIATIYLLHHPVDGNTTTYTLSTAESIPDNLSIFIDPGAIIGGAGTLTFNSPEQIIAQPTQQIFGSSLSLVFTNPGILHAAWNGALGDGSTDDSTAIQELIDALEVAKGGTVKFLSRVYVCNLEIKEYVELLGDGPTFKPSTGGSTTHNKTYLKADSTGHIVTTAAGALTGMSIRNISFIGLGSATPVKGIYLQNVSKSLFQDIAFDNISDEAIRINDGNANHFNRIFAQNCLLDTSQAAKIGVLHIEIGADDQWVSSCEFTASVTGLSNANKYLCGVVVGSSNNFFKDVVGEISDIGFHITADGDRNRFIGCRADLNYGHGFEIAGGGGNQFMGCFAYRNGQETDNIYDGFNSVGCSNNIFIGCNVQSVSGDAQKHRYGFYDDINSAAGRSKYVGCNSNLHQTASYSGNSAFGISPNFGDAGMITGTPDDATPSVDSVNVINLGNYTQATNVTDFDDGLNGQVLRVFDSSANGYITVVHNATYIITNTGANKALVQNKIYTFVNTYGVWREVV